MEVTTKIALVTGGSRGLGRSMATSIASRGIGVILTYRANGEEAKSVVQQIQASGQQAVAL